MKTGRWLAAMAGLMVISPSAAAHARGAGDETDLRCFIASTALSKSHDQRRAASGLVSTFYFLGRLEGRDPTFDMARRLPVAARKLSRQELIAALHSCGQAMIAEGEAINRSGANIQPFPGF